MTAIERLEQIQDLCERTINLKFEGLVRDLVDRDILNNTVSQIAAAFGVTAPEDIEHLIIRLEERFDIKMTLGNYFEGEDYIPWLDDKRVEIDWFFWRRYKRLLTENGYPPNVVSSLDLVTDKIVDHLEDPQKLGEWSRRGLVVGHVQSGKTANYSGVICKAADAGYKIIIVLAGMLSSLRSQTQERIDHGFIGVDSSKRLDNPPLKDILVGVGKFDHTHVPVSFTTTVHDFKSTIAQQIRVGIGDLNQPTVLVIKKNKSILQNLINWLKTNNLDLNQFPFLLVDDEADHASINTNKENKDPTAINSKIRELLRMFPQNTYLAYTATPFANIFIDPEDNDEMIGDELFPRDFIISLDPPSNYIGSKRIFGESGDLNSMVIEVKDHEDLFPTKHDKNYFPPALPDSLELAIRVFIIIRTIRILRGQESKHNSMLVNVSRFTMVQSNIRVLVHQFLDEVRRNIINYYALPKEEALKNKELRTLKSIFESEYSDTEFRWEDIQKQIKLSVAPIKTIEVNGSTNAEALDYNNRDYPNGRNLIAIGGLSLSRGLTLEGLTVSYFIRNTQMYDTLMQMGRWFGYRDGYGDLCRLYMAPESIAWYQHISDVTEELRDEFRMMEKAKLTPTDFGLCVRSHPESLIVTARNKMRTGKKVPRQISLFGRQIETSILLSNSGSVKSNLMALDRLCLTVAESNTNVSDNKAYLYLKVKQQLILDFIDEFTNHPASIMTEKVPLKDYIEQIGLDWDLQVISSTGHSPISRPIEDISVKAVRRTVLDKPTGGVSTDKRRFSSPSWEAAGIDSVKVKTLREQYPADQSIPGKAYRETRDRPLLTLYLLDCRYKESEDSIFELGAPAWSISFPGKTGSRKPEKLVEYIVNTTWWNNEFGGLMEEEDEGDHDD
jgi:hypothetical protein